MSTGQARPRALSHCLEKLQNARNPARMKGHAMTTRYISNSERAAQLAVGTGLYGLYMDSSPRSPDYDAKLQNWENWRHRWGEKMEAIARKTSLDLFEQATGKF